MPNCGNSLARDAVRRQAALFPAKEKSLVASLQVRFSVGKLVRIWRLQIREPPARLRFAFRARKETWPEPSGNRRTVPLEKLIRCRCGCRLVSDENTASAGVRPDDDNPLNSCWVMLGIWFLSSDLVPPTNPRSVGALPLLKKKVRALP